MMKFLTAAVAAAGMTVVTFGLADLASDAPNGASPIEQTVKTLEASGYYVVVNRPDDALPSCSVGAVRQGQGGHAGLLKTVYLDVAC